MERFEENLIEEIENDYSTAMNKIIFDTYVQNFENNFDIKEILFLKKEKDKLKKKIHTGEPDCKGIIDVSSECQVEGKNFTYKNNYSFKDTFKEFCFSSLFIKNEAIEALQEIRIKCKELENKNLFALEQKKNEIKRVDQFKTIQESSINQLGTQLKTTWIFGMISLIKHKFEFVGKGWFNMKETNKLTYEFGKLKRFLTVIRLNMQDSVFDLLKRSLQEFVLFFKDRIPERTEVISEKEINHYYKNGQIDQPILSVDFIQVAGKKEFNFLFKPDKIRNDILSLFEKAIEELKTIPDLEPKVVEQLNKAKKSETYILTSILPKSYPETPDPTIIPKRYCDENKWVWDLKEDLNTYLKKAVTPLREFKTHFEKYKDILAIKPEKFVIEIEEGENKGNLEFIKNEIIKWQEKEKSLKKQIPEEIQVGCFIIDCKEALRILLGKYQEINKKLIEMLAKKLKENGFGILRKLKDFEKEIYQSPEDIESLSQLKEFVEINLPQEMETICQEINTCVQIYEMLENQNYKLSKQELDKRWILIGGPKKLEEIIGIFIKSIILRGKK